MSFWTAIVVIAAIGAFYSLRRNREAMHYRAQQDQWADGAEPRPAREAELEREIRDLRERVKVLERIATDDRRSRAIADEIENLRDK